MVFFCVWWSVGWGARFLGLLGWAQKSGTTFSASESKKADIITEIFPWHHALLARIAGYFSGDLL